MLPIEQNSCRHNCIAISLKDLFDKMNKKDQIIIKLIDEVLVLKDNVSRWEQKMNENDTCERRDTFLLCIYLLLGGNSLLVTTEAENTKQVLEQLVCRKININ